ncbi:hypothetical protein Ancab_024107 [Ancistrocladus abbreviatus]
MSPKGLTPDIVTYSTLIQGSYKAKKPQLALQMFTEMQASGLTPDCITHAVLMEGLCKSGQLDKAMTILEKCEKKRLPFNIIIYNILIDGLFEAGRHSSAVELFSSLPNKNLQPSIRTYTVMLKGLCKAGLPVEATELLTRMEEKGFFPNEFCYNIIIQGLLLNDDYSKALHYVNVMKDKGFSAIASTTAKLVNLMCDNRLDESTKELIRGSILHDKATEIKRLKSYVHFSIPVDGSRVHMWEDPWSTEHHPFNPGPNVAATIDVQSVSDLLTWRKWNEDREKFLSNSVYHLLSSSDSQVEDKGVTSLGRIFGK